MRESQRRDLVWTIVRAATAALIAAAIVRQLVESVTRTAARGGDVVTVVVNFFSFFTILSNAVAVIVLAWAAIWFWTRGRRGTDAEPFALAVALASVTTYMIITGIVYNVLLRGVELPQGSEPVPWSNEVLHVVAPIVLLIDLFVGPRRRALPWTAILGVLALPVLWVVYTLVRGPLVTSPATGAPYWYPYPFLDPNSATTGGYGGVAAYVIGIAAAIALVAVFVVWWGRRVGTHVAPAATSPDAALTPAE